MTTGAASVEITMPARAGHVVADISGGAASFDVVIPEGVAAEIASSSSLSSFDVDTRRFPRSGELYVSPDFDTAMPARAGHVVADISGGAASFDVVIPEGVAAEIASSSSLSSFDVDTRRFPRSGELYVSPDFDTAENRVILDFQLGVSSVVVH